ncbi:rhomboid-related protein 3-like [Panulirus ornatus]|uniref:rhomboid-related protein 3-like n=1 Tax=Panulirus ornatus TaxID=150431 RepID=UPI003A88D85B
MVRVSWGGEVVIADLAHVAGDGGNGGDGEQSRPVNGVPTPTSTTPQTATPTTSATPSETPTISPAPTLSPPPTVSPPPPRAPTAIIEALSDGDESAVSTSFSDDHRSLRDDLHDDLSSPRPRSPRRRPEKSHVIKIDDDNNNENGNGDITISSDEYRRFLTLKGSPPDAAAAAKTKGPATRPIPSAPTEYDIIKSMDRMLATLSDLEDDLEPIDGVETESDSGSDEAEARRELLTDKWRQLFDKFDLEGFGEIPWPDFRNALVHPEFVAAVDVHKREQLAAKALTPTTTAITFQDFVNVMSGKRSRSFKCAVHHRDRQVSSETDFHLLLHEPPIFNKMVRLIADEFLTEERDRKYYADHYRCWPPPLFIIAVTLVQLGVFAYYTITTGEMNVAGPVAVDSLFIYRPDKRHHVWRFIFYAFLHAGWVHLAFNLLVQLLVGLPLEMVHGSARIGTVYLAGVLAGSLGTSVFDADVYLVGASGGVYALLAAHLANVLINYNNMQFGILRLIGVFFVASADVGFAIYDRYAHETVGLPVSYVAHLTGALAGLTLGLVVLKNFEQRLHEQLLWWVALGVYAACTLFAVLFNLFHPYPYVGVAQGLLL